MVLRSATQALIRSPDSCESCLPIGLWYGVLQRQSASETKRGLARLPELVIMQRFASSLMVLSHRPYELMLVPAHAMTVRQQRSCLHRNP